MEEVDWQRLIRQLNDGRCTPFLGAGACDGVVDDAASMSRRLADRYSYPFQETWDLARVMQYAAIEEGDPVTAKEALVASEFTGLRPPDFADLSEPHGALARFPLPVYITTNYDGFMAEALRGRGKHPRQLICPWYPRAPYNVQDSNRPTGSDDPIVYHLHGSAGTAESLVVTEDDYVEFLTALIAEKAGMGDTRLLPASIQEYMTTMPLLFIGYSLRDWTFRVIFRWLLSTVPVTHQRQHISVQLSPVGARATKLKRQKAELYLERYLRGHRISLYFGSARQFFADLHSRMDPS